MINKKRKKIFYVPGMISLIFIPLLSLFHFYKTDAFKIYAGMYIYWGDEKSFLDYKVSTARKYKIFNFDESELINKKKLNEMKFCLRELIKRRDTINGIIAHFGSQTRYDVFIDVLDVLAVEKTPVYALYRNDLYVWGCRNEPKKDLILEKRLIEPQMNCGTGELMREQVYREQKNRREEEVYNFQISFFKKQWILFLGYFGIVLLNIFALVKFNKKR